MARNEERDRQEADRRKDRLIQAGFELFSHYGIESVSLSAVAEKANVGVSTMYKYFQNKVNLAVAISGRIWGDTWNSALNQLGAQQIDGMDTSQLFEIYADIIISLYREKPQVLRYSGNYKTYIRREGIPTEMLADHLDPLKPIATLFHTIYASSAARHLVRTDVPEEKIFSFTALTMLATAERYAQGIVWAENEEADHVEDLTFLKEMLSDWIKGKPVS